MLPYIDKLLPASIELAVELTALPIVKFLFVPVEVNITLDELLMVRLCIAGDTLITIVAVTLITTSCAGVGTRFSDQFAAVFQLLPEVPIQVLVCPIADPVNTAKTKLMYKGSK